jgi:hypothetical protein
MTIDECRRIGAAHRGKGVVAHLAAEKVGNVLIQVAAQHQAGAQDGQRVALIVVGCHQIDPGNIVDGRDAVFGCRPVHEVQAGFDEAGNAK